jgi:dolichol-phosphate mannosyltransferase
MQAVSIIVPTFNEAENIDLLLKRIFAVEGLQKLDLEIVFSDGDSTDKTRERIQPWMESHKVRLVHNEISEGLSAAVMAGARAATGEYVVVMDADLSHPPEVIPDMLEPLFSHNYDMVIGSRNVKGGSTPDWPASRKLSSFLATLPARLLTDVKDPLAGFIAVRRERLAEMERKVCGFKIGLEVLATGEEEMRVKEIPITFRDRCFGMSKMSPKVVIDYFKQLLILAGICLLPLRLNHLLQIFLVTFVTDTSLLTFFVEHNIRPGWAQCFSFIPAMGLAAALGLWRKKQYPENSVYTVNQQYGNCRHSSRKFQYVLGFCWTTLLSLFLRSGIVAAFSSPYDKLSTAAVFVVGIAGIAMSYGGNVLYIFSIGRKRIRGVLVQRFYGIGIAVYLALLRLVYCMGADYLAEEQFTAGKFYNTQQPLASEAAGQLTVYASVMGLRLINWGIWLIAAVCIFNLVRDIYGRSVAFKAFLLFSVLPFFVGTGLFVSSDSFLSLFWCGSMYLFYRAFVRENSNAWLWLGCVFGFGLQLHPVLLVLLPGVVVYLVLSKDYQKWMNRREPYLAVAIALLTLLPSILAGGIRWGSEPYIGPSWIDSIFGISVSQNYLIGFLLLSPTGLLAGCYGLMQWLRLPSEAANGRTRERSRNQQFILSMFFVPMLLLLVPGMIGNTAVYVGSLAWIVLLPTMAMTLDNQLAGERPITRFLNVVWWPTIAVLVMLYGYCLHVSVV